MRKMIRGRPHGGLVVSVLLAALVAGCGGSDGDQRERGAEATRPAASADYPTGAPKHLARPFVGKPVPASWFGRWRFQEADVDNHILPADSPECRAITRGRTTCWTVGPRGSSTEAYDVYAAGAVTVKGQMVVWRMTYNPNPDSPQCFADDAYRYRYTPRRIYIPLDDDPRHCFYDRADSQSNPRLRRLKMFAILTRVA